MKNRMLKILICLLFILIPINLAFSEPAELTLSGGLGAGYLSEDFEISGETVKLQYSAPGALMAAELGWGNFYMEMSLSLLFLPYLSNLGGEAVDLENYEINLGLDFTAIGIGYMFQVDENLEIGGSAGFHVSSIMLSPPDSDYTRLALEGYYGLIGMNITPRVRYSINKSIVTTISVPIGFDFSAMSDDVVVANVDGSLTNTGQEIPAIVAPDGLNPLYKGFTIGLYISIGYQLEMPF